MLNCFLFLIALCVYLQINLYIVILLIINILAAIWSVFLIHYILFNLTTNKWSRSGIHYKASLVLIYQIISVVLRIYPLQFTFKIFFVLKFIIFFYLHFCKLIQFLIITHFKILLIVWKSLRLLIDCRLSIILRISKKTGSIINNNTLSLLKVLLKLQFWNFNTLFMLVYHNLIFLLLDL